ncbi:MULTISPECIES: hypothetical protein [unclassified Streptomyces]|uniref:hypothetical protein n=1 Tax=unclassified Streptomyces TaxID=2593676 RepID=UPI002F914B7C
MLGTQPLQHSVALSYLHRPACLVIEHVFYDVPRHAVTLDYSGRPYVTRHRPTPEELARRE